MTAEILRSKYYLEGAWHSLMFLTNGIVVFTFGGQYFEALHQTILGRDSTLLANLVDDMSTDSSKLILVDANPDRFQCIFGWYCYGEMYLPDSISLEAVLRDAHFVLLLNIIRMNSAICSIRSSRCT